MFNKGTIYKNLTKVEGTPKECGPPQGQREAGMKQFGSGRKDG